MGLEAEAELSGLLHDPSKAASGSPSLRTLRELGAEVRLQCQAGHKEWARLRDRLLTEYKADEDSLRLTDFLDESAARRTEHYRVGSLRSKRSQPPRL
jgi:hypothetical protein